jgi:hypothetical protein
VGGWVGGWGSHVELLGIMSKNNLSAPPPEWPSAMYPCCPTLPLSWLDRYNHYAGRLGIPMPETAKLLAAHPVEHFSFHCESGGWARVWPPGRGGGGVPGGGGGGSAKGRGQSAAVCVRGGG